MIRESKGERRKGKLRITPKTILRDPVLSILLQNMERRMGRKQETNLNKSGTLLSSGIRRKRTDQAIKRIQGCVYLKDEGIQLKSNKKIPPSITKRDRNTKESVKGNG